MPTRRAIRTLGVVAGVVFVAGGLLVAATYRSLREGPLPGVVLGEAFLLAAILWTTQRLELGKPRLLARLGSALGLASLGVVLGFFVAVVSLEGFTDRVPEWMASLGTFVGSVATLLALPIGLLLVGVTALADSRLPGWTRPLPLVATLLLLAGPASIALLPEGRLEGQVAALMFSALGIGWAGYAFGMAATLSGVLPGGDRPDTAPEPSDGAPTRPLFL